MKKALELATYEGLIFTTAARYAPILDDDIEDIQQVLRVKVWKALTAFDPTRVVVKEEAVERWVFSCVRNQVKDLLKSQSRRNEARNGRQDYLSEIPDELRDSFESRYLTTSADEVYGEVEDEQVPLPATLNDTERSVVYLLLLEMSQTEIAVVLRLPRDKVRRARDSVQEKMADWKPESEPVALPVAA